MTWGDLGTTVISATNLRDTPGLIKVVLSSDIILLSGRYPITTRGYIESLRINTDQTVTLLYTLDLGAGGCSSAKFLWLTGNIYAVVGSMGPNYYPYIKTISVNPTTGAMSVIQTLLLAGTAPTVGIDFSIELRGISGGNYIVITSYILGSTASMVKTVSITPDGVTITELGSFAISSGAATTVSKITLISGSIYMAMWRLNATSHIYIRPITVSADGITIAWGSYGQTDLGDYTYGGNISKIGPGVLSFMMGTNTPSTSAIVLNYVVADDGAMGAYVGGVTHTPNWISCHMVRAGVNASTGHILTVLQVGGYSQGISSIEWTTAGVFVAKLDTSGNTVDGFLPQIVTLNVNIAGQDFTIATGMDMSTVDIYLYVNTLVRTYMSIISVVPGTGVPESTLDVVIIGTNLGEVNRLEFGSGITINSFSIISETEIHANLTIAVSAILGFRDVSTYSRSEYATLINGFEVTGACIRITNLVHRYDRSRQSYTLEITIGGVTSDLGLPEWISVPMPAVTKAPAKTPTTPVVTPSVNTPTMTPEDEARPGTRGDADKGNQLWQTLTPWKESGGQTVKVYDEFVINVAKSAWRALTPWHKQSKEEKSYAQTEKIAEEVYQRQFGLSVKQVQELQKRGKSIAQIQAEYGKKK
ncbi:MAG: hypothetical protein WC364_05670 [Eubacteriales bacterium]